MTEIAGAAQVLRPSLVGQRRLERRRTRRGHPRARPRRPVAGDHRLAAPAAAARHRAAGQLGGRLDRGVLRRHHGRPRQGGRPRAHRGPRVSLAEAQAATAAYRGFVSHPFPSCFTCGTGRDEGDGLRIFPGDVAGDEQGRVAAPWTPHPSVAEDWHTYQEPARDASLPVTWAALDCVGGWSTDIEERAMVLGTITAAAGRPAADRRGARARRRRARGRGPQDLHRRDPLRLRRRGGGDRRARVDHRRPGRVRLSR